MRLLKEEDEEEEEGRVRVGALVRRIVEVGN